MLLETNEFKRKEILLIMDSILGTALLVFPMRKDCLTFFPINIDEFNFSIIYSRINFLIDELVIKSDGRGIFLGTGVIHSLWSCPIYCAETHRSEEHTSEL